MDLYRDFAYCRLTADLAAGATTATVDETSRLPTNDELAGGEFWMTFESTLSVGQFEIVRLVSKSVETGPGTVVLERGQQGSSSYAYSATTVFKHALTAEMLRRLVALSQQGGVYRRYVDLGNAVIAGTSTVDTEPTVLRGVAAGQAGGATVVAGALIFRGFSATVVTGSSAAAADLTVTQTTTTETQGAEVFGNQMFGS